MRQTPYLKQLAIICSAYAVSGLLALHMAIPPATSRHSIHRPALPLPPS
jgi:hypothetical protein